MGQPFRALGADHHTALTRLNPGPPLPTDSTLCVWQNTLFR